MKKLNKFPCKCNHTFLLFLGKNCGWMFSKDENQFEKDYGISYPMLVSPTTARNQYQQGLPFKATFDEFINGLYFYSEMTFIHNKINYVMLHCS